MAILYGDGVNSFGLSYHLLLIKSRMQLKIGKINLKFLKDFRDFQKFTGSTNSAGSLQHCES